MQGRDMVSISFSFLWLPMYSFIVRSTGGSLWCKGRTVVKPMPQIEPQQDAWTTLLPHSSAVEHWNLCSVFAHASQNEMLILFSSSQSYGLWTSTALCACGCVHPYGVCGSWYQKPLSCERLIMWHRHKEHGSSLTWHFDPATVEKLWQQRKVRKKPHHAHWVEKMLLEPNPKL